MSPVEFTIDIQTKSHGRHRNCTAYITPRMGQGRLDEKEVSQAFNRLGPCEPEYITHFVIGAFG